MKRWILGKSGAWSGAVLRER